MIPEVLKRKFDSGICVMCDRPVGKGFRDRDSRDRYAETGYCQACLDLEFGDVENQGVHSINWEECLRKILKRVDHAETIIQTSGLSEDDQAELLRML